MPRKRGYKSGISVSATDAERFPLFADQIRTIESADDRDAKAATDLSGATAQPTPVEENSPESSAVNTAPHVPQVNVLNFGNFDEGVAILDDAAVRSDDLFRDVVINSG